MGCGLLGKTFAQSTWYEEEQRTFYAGPVFGANFTQVDGDNYAGYHKTGFNVGGILYAHLADQVAVSMEILFSQKGARGNFAKQLRSGAILQKYKINMNYAEVPIQLCLFDKRKTNYGIGLSYSQLIGTRETATVTPTTVTVPDFEKDYPVKKMDLNFVGGVNFHLYKGFFLNVRFQYSVIPIRTNVPVDFGRQQQFNNVFCVRLMYLFI